MLEAAEKAREERLTRLGYEVVRVTWSDLEDPVALVRRVVRARQIALQRRAAMKAARYRSERVSAYPR